MPKSIGYLDDSRCGMFIDRNPVLLFFGLFAVFARER
jgi:hypothetical protein